MAQPSNRAAPLVAIVMGSSSDYDVMKGAVAIMKEFGVAHEVRVISAHRTPDAAYEFSRTAKERGLKLILAAAGKSAHLAGVLAASTIIPVVGVPMKTSDLGGLDSLLSMVQMPAGIPVGTVAIGDAGAKNAALFAVAILALADPSLSNQLEEYRMCMADEVRKSDARIQDEQSK